MPLLPCNPLKGVDCTFAHLGGLLVGVFEILLALSTFVALLFIVWGGFQMVYGWFDEDPEGTFKNGKNTVRRAIFGLVLVIGAFLIVETVLAIFGVTGGVNRFLKEAFG